MFTSEPVTRRRISTTVVLLLVAAIGWVAPAHASETATRAATRAPALGEYRIGPADVLQISVWKNEALSRSIPVRPDGMISLALVNDVQAAGLTPMELRDVLARKLSEYMPNPEISVIVEEVHSYTVSVLGEVRTPGRYELKSRATVLDVLAQAEGFSEFASRSRILILRRDGDEMRRIPFNYEKILSGGDRQENFVVQPGDIILVP